MIYKTILSLTDADTGEIYAINNDKCKERCMMPLEVSRVKAIEWLSSLFRGVKQGKNLSFTVTIRQYRIENEESLF